MSSQQRNYNALFTALVVAQNTRTAIQLESLQNILSTSLCVQIMHTLAMAHRHGDADTADQVIGLLNDHRKSHAKIDDKLRVIGEIMETLKKDLEGIGHDTTVL